MSKKKVKINFSQYRFTTVQLTSQGFAKSSIFEYKDWAKVNIKKKKKVVQVIPEFKAATHYDYTKYLKYLKSPKWRELRENLFKVRGKKCEMCDKVTNIQVHHLTYKRLFNEPLSDLLVVCDSCHKDIHDVK